MNIFDTQNYKIISNYYIQYHGDKNQMISRILLDYHDHQTRSKYIHLIDFYITIMNTHQQIQLETNMFNEVFNV
jgi:hypothetical protein